MIAEFTERDIFEMPLKGWRTLEVELEDGSRYSLNFYEPVRLGQTLVHEVALGRPCLAEPNLVMVPELTVEAMRESIKFLYDCGYFTELKAEE